MKLRIVPSIFAVALLASLMSPAVAHDGEHHGKEETGWPGSAKGQEVARAFLADAQPAQELTTQSTSTCEGGAAAGYPCSNVDLLSFLPLADIGGGKGNDIWGWTDPVTGREYAIMGRSTGTSFVDITTPSSPVYLGNLPTTRFSSTWRDIKVYADHAFVVSEAMNHGMQVFDLRQLRNVTNPPVTFSMTAHYKGIRTAHNVAINEATGYAYVVGSDTCSGGLHIVDIRTPASPQEAGCFSADGYTHDVQCVVYQGADADYLGREICIASNEDTVTVIDVTNKAAPAMVARVPYAGAEYTHQGWLTEDQRYFLLDDELDEDRRGHNTHTYIWDMGDLDTPLHVSTFVGNTSAIDHNQYVKGSYSYQADYRAGLRVLDISRVADGVLAEVGYFDVYPADDASEFNGAWSTYPYFASGSVVVSGIEQGLFVVRPNLGTTANSAPSVEVVDPAELATVGGTVPIRVAASDLEDAGGSLDVAWNVDGGPWQTATFNATSGYYESTWDTTAAADGSHTLRARATDSSLATATDANSVNVENIPNDTVVLHVGDLDGAAKAKGKGGRWEATVTVTVHDGSDATRADVTVTGSWSGGVSGTASGVTGTDGTVSFSSGSLSTASATFTVTNLSADGSSYDANGNHDPDSDSDGTTITVTR